MFEKFQVIEIRLPQIRNPNSTIRNQKMAKEKLQNDSPAFKERVKVEEMTLDAAAGKLAKFGGFDLLETTVDGVQNMNPEKKARKKIFLTNKFVSLSSLWFCGCGEMVDALDLGSSEETCGGSSPSSRTILIVYNKLMKASP